MKKLIDEITKAIMIQRGYKPGEHLLEWDPKCPDSQFFMIREDVEFVVKFLKKKGTLS